MSRKRHWSLERKGKGEGGKRDEEVLEEGHIQGEGREGERERDTSWKRDETESNERDISCERDQTERNERDIHIL